MFHLAVFTLLFCLFHEFLGALLLVLFVCFFCLASIPQLEESGWLLITEFPKSQKEMSNFQIQNQVLGGVTAENQCKRCLPGMRSSSFYL